MTTGDELIPELTEEGDDSERVPNMGRFVFGSRPRIEILREVQQGAHYSDLTATHSDSLVSSTVNDFREENLAVKTDDNYVRLTPLGEYLMDSYASLVADLRQVARVDDFFDAVSPAGYEIIEPRILEGGETLSGTPVDKNAVITDYVEYIREADTIKEVVPRLIRAGLYDMDGNSIFRKQIVEGELECTFIHTEDVVDAVSAADTQRAEAREHQETSRVAYHRYDGEFPFTLTIYDDELVTILLNDADGVKVLFQNDTDDCLDWANALFDDYLAECERIRY